MSSLLSALAVCLPLITHGAVSVPQPDDQPPVKLEYTYQIGEPVRYEVDSYQFMLQIAMGQVASTSESTNTVLRRELLDVREDGTLVVSERVEQYSTEQKVNDEVYTFDSENPEHESGRNDLRVRTEVETLGWSTDLIMTPLGEIIGVANEAQIAQKIDAIEDKALRDEVRAAYSTPAIIREGNPFSKLFGENPVGVGDSWSVSYVVDDQPMSMAINQRMTVVSIFDRKEGKEVRVNFEGTIDFEMPEEFPDFMEVKENSIKGHFVFNTQIGTVTDYRSTLSIEFRGSPGEGIPEVSISSSLRTDYDMIED